MKRIMLFFMIVLFSSSAVAEWTRLGNDGELGGEIFINKKSINKVGNIAKIWTLTNYAKRQSAGGKKQLSTKSWYEYDCQNEQYRTLILYWYSGHMGKGKIVYSEIVYSGRILAKMQPIIPNSAVERIWKITCGKE